MAYGMWPGLQTAIPGGINIAHGVAQYQNQQEQLAINKIKHQQILKQEEEMNKPVAKEFLMSSFGITDATPNRKKYFEQVYSNLDPEGKGFTTRGEVKAMGDMIGKDKDMQGGLIQAHVEDAKLDFETAQKKYDDTVLKAKEKGTPIEKDEKIQQLREQRDRMHDIYTAVYAKAQGSPAGFTENQKMERMVAGKEEDYRRMQAQQTQITERALELKAKEAEIRTLLKQMDERIKATGEAGKDRRSNPTKDTAFIKEYKAAREAFTDNGLAVPQHLMSPDKYKEWLKSRPGPPKAGGDAMSNIFNPKGTASGPAANYKDMGNGVLQYVRPGE